jgi:hypothetical protein
MGQTPGIRFRNSPEDLVRAGRKGLRVSF